MPCRASFLEVAVIKRKYLGKTKGFTLIELLIVVGIIALLVSILMPALRAAKERAKRILCSSQLHQMGIVFIQYAQDFDGAFPSFETNRGRYLFAVADDFMSWLGDGFASEQFPQLAPGHYGLTHKVFYCPGMQPNKFHGYMVDDWWWYYFDFVTGATNPSIWELVPNAANGSTQCDLVNMGYALYVPRQGNCNPTCGGESPYLTSADWQLNPGREYRGPRKTSDLEAIFNPIMSDNVNAWYRSANTPSIYQPGLNTHPVYSTYFANHDRVALTGLPAREKLNSLDELSPHISNGLVTQANSLYSDGRVVANPGETIVPYYAVHRAQFW